MKFVNTTKSASMINLASLDTILGEDLMGCFAKLRTENDISWHQHPDSGNNGFWAFVKYKDINKIITDTKTFTNSEGIQVIFERDMPHASQHSMLEMDPPEHSKYRKVVSSPFSPRGTSMLEPRIRNRVETLLIGMEGRKKIDFLEEFAKPLPMTVFFDLMGVPETDHSRIMDLADRGFFAADPSFGGDQQGLVEAGMEIQEYGRWLGEKRRHNPKDDLTSIIAQAQLDDRLLSLDELGAFFGLLGSAGADTTRSALAYGLDALTNYPKQKQLWLEDIDGHALKATDEIIRWASPAYHMRRTATKNIEIRGRAIKKGDKISVWFISGNHDEDVFDKPHDFNITRDPNPHISFGLKGPHYCLGVHLAKLEVRIAFCELLRRFPDIESTGPITRLRSNFVNSPSTMSAHL